MKIWHELYVAIFQVLRASALRSMGSVDPDHRKSIEEEIEFALKKLDATRAKDETNATVIAALFDLVFLLLGRRPYRARGKFRNWSAFRTLTYSQTEEQFSYLLQSYMHRRPREHGFCDFLRPTTPIWFGRANGRSRGRTVRRTVNGCASGFRKRMRCFGDSSRRPPFPAKGEGVGGRVGGFGCHACFHGNSFMILFLWNAKNGQKHTNRAG